MRAKAVTIGKAQAHLREGNHRVTAQVAGREVWFESRDFPLQASPEAMGSALLLPALFAGVELQLEQAVCPRWLEGAKAANALAVRWWQLPHRRLEASSRPAPLTTKLDVSAQCFTGGLDSFHSLLRGKHRPKLLVFVHGYDIALGDEVRLRAFENSLERVATASRARPVVIRSNLREHPLVASTSWTLTHGGALAAIGHLLSGHASQLVLASSVPRDYHIPWGSHWQLDPNWSSGAMEILHDGADFPREQKAWAVAGEPLLKQHLRVCWENRSPTGNCSRCDKCVNTMLLLEQSGELANYTVFNPPHSFEPLLDALPYTTFVRVYRAMCQRGLPSETEAAVQRLLRRTKRHNARQLLRTRLRRALDRVLFRRRHRA